MSRSPDPSCGCSAADFPFHCAEPEDCREEHLSTDLVVVVSWIKVVYDIPSSPSEAKKMLGFHAGIDPNY